MRFQRIETAELERLRRDSSAAAVLMADLRDEIERLGRLTGQELVAGFAVRHLREPEALLRVRAELERLWDRRMPPRPVSRLPERDDERLDPEAMRVFEALGVSPEDVRRAREREARR